ncbi:uncharacterized protein LOC143231903 [Tachypleus tridentatus]|uniref:uncharacterized protein LOC143231903 n=1 Tax=Tachypleus tridentatus TaxID=6853 RepID=UPI003FD07899
MVDISGSGHNGPIEHGFSNWVFVVPTIITVILVGFFGYKLVNNLRQKERMKEEKKKQKIQRKEKEAKKKLR